MIWNNFANGLSETREWVSDGYYWDSDAVETRLLPWVRLAKYSEERVWNIWTGWVESGKKVVGLVTLGSNGSKDYFAFLRNGDMTRYQVSSPWDYLSTTGSFPLGGVITDIVETPRGVYWFWETSALSITLQCKIFYIAKTTVSQSETLDYGLMFTTPSRIDFTHNNTAVTHFYGKKYATLIDNQALMWSSRASGGKTNIYMMDYEALIPLVSQPWTIVDTLPWTCTGITVQWEYVYVYMQDRLFYYSLGDLLNGVANTLIPTGSLQTPFKVYDVQEWQWFDWVMTSNGLMKRSGLSFSLVSGNIFGIFGGAIGESPLINAITRGNEISGNRLTTYSRKNNFFRWGFSWSEFCDWVEETAFGKNGQYLFYKDWNLKLISKQFPFWGNVDSPWYFPLTENTEFGQFCPTGSISSCRFYASAFQQVKYLKALKVSFLLNGGTISVDIRTNKNEAFTQIGSWSWTSNACGAEIKAPALNDKEIQWLEYRVRMTRWDDTTKTPVFYGIIPIYEEMTKEF